MYRHSPHHSDNESSENKYYLKIILNELRPFNQFSIIEADLRTLRKKEEKKSKISRSGT